MEKFPENTDIAFEEALRVGSHGLETGFVPFSPASRKGPTDGGR